MVKTIWTMFESPTWIRRNWTGAFIVYFYLTSSKIERFLQLVDSNGINHNYPQDKLPDHRKLNIGVVQPTSASNYFHLLRRQMLRSFRKPLVIVSPKIGLRHNSYFSKFEEFEKQFNPFYINELSKGPITNVDTLVFCTGQVFMDILKQRNENSSKAVVLVRIEELAPFPELSIKESLKKYKLSNSTKVYWIQEESMNSGAYTYCEPHIRRLTKSLGLDGNVDYIGRDAQIGANGALEWHKREVENLSNQINKTIN